jgi:hypothetical protein
MMAVASVPLVESLQTLIDSRLDTIDRMLLGRLARQDRLAIVHEVEAQIHDLLGERDNRDLSRDDVLAVLARLDPPEAYLPDEAAGETVRPRPASPARVTPPARKTVPGIAKASGILGVVTLTMLFVFGPLFWLLAAQGGFGLGEIFVIAILLFTPLISVVGLVLGLCARLNGAWAIAGVVAGAVSLLVSMAAGILVLLRMSFV